MVWMLTCLVIFLALTKSIGFRSDTRTDDRCYWLSRISSISLSLAIPTVYPRMFSIDEHSIKVVSHMFLMLLTMEMLYKLHTPSLFVLVAGCWRWSAPWDFIPVEWKPEQWGHLSAWNRWRCIYLCRKSGFPWGTLPTVWRTHSQWNTHKSGREIGSTIYSVA